MVQIARGTSLHGSSDLPSLQSPHTHHQQPFHRPAAPLASFFSSPGHLRFLTIRHISLSFPHCPAPRRAAAMAPPLRAPLRQSGTRGWGGIERLGGAQGDGDSAPRHVAGPLPLDLVGGSPLSAGAPHAPHNIWPGLPLHQPLLLPAGCRVLKERVGWLCCRTKSERKDGVSISCVPARRLPLLWFQGFLSSSQRCPGRRQPGRVLRLSSGNTVQPSSLPRAPTRNGSVAQG